MNQVKTYLKILSLAIICIIIFSPWSSFSQKAGLNPALPYLQAGDRFFEQGKYKEALAEYQKALNIDPNNQYAKFQIEQIKSKTGIGLKVEPNFEVLPPRDYSKISYELGPYYKDPINKFAIRYPKKWLVDNSDPDFAVKFIEPYSEAFLFIKVIPTPEFVLINYQFRDHIEKLIKELLSQIPDARLRYCNFEKFKNDTVLRVEILFKAGKNLAIITTRIISDIDRIIIISWVCQEKLYYTFQPWVESSIATLKLSVE